VRGLLWKREVPDYNRIELNTGELIDLLKKKLIQKGIIREESGG
jgi:hypothetical protein